MASIVISTTVRTGKYDASTKYNLKRSPRPERVHPAGIVPQKEPPKKSNTYAKRSKHLYDTSTPVS